MMKRGTQIVYVPYHAEGDADHPDCEPGFVTSVHRNERAAFCRYWRKPELDQLRTTANSELTPIISLIICDTVPQSQVDAALERYCQ